MREVLQKKIDDSLSAEIPQFTRRDVRLPRIPGKAIAVIGMRRAGKTTFLWQILADRLRQGVPRAGLLYLNFEDERLAGIKAADLQWVIEEYYAKHPEWRDRKRATFLLDEIQSVPGWETFARRMLDTERVDLFLSGSSARLLSREVATSMRGRSMEALVHPFNFREHLRHFGREPRQPITRLPKAGRSMLQRELGVYLSCGGFPEALGAGTRDRVELLRGYVDTAVLRDVVERHAVSNPVALRWMIRQLLGNAAGPFSVNKFHRDLHSQGIPAGKDALHAYLSHLEDAFLIRTVSIASESPRKRMSNPLKIFPIDPGLIPVFDRSGRANEGHALETCILLELERRGAEISYVRTSDGYEVDFLARYPDGREELIQSCADPNEPAVLQRELRALMEARAQFPRATLHLVALRTDGLGELPQDVSLHWAASWLLEPQTAH